MRFESPEGSIERENNTSLHNLKPSITGRLFFLEFFVLNGSVRPPVSASSFVYLNKKLSSSDCIIWSLAVTRVGLFSSYL